MLLSESKHFCLINIICNMSKFDSLLSCKGKCSVSVEMGKLHFKFQLKVLALDANTELLN